MPDLYRDAQRISFFKSASVAGSSGTAVSDTWNIPQGQAFTLWTNALASSAAVACAISMYPGINGGGTPVVDTIAALALGALNESSIEINATICKSVKMTLTNSGSQVEVVSLDLMMY